MKRVAASIALVGVLVSVPLVLLSLSGAPAIPSFEGIRLNDTYMPLDPVLKMVALLAWMLWIYLAAATLLRTFALLAARTTDPASRFLGASTAMTPRVLRTWIDFAIGGALLAATINPRLGANLDRVAQARPVATEASAAHTRPDAITAPEGRPTYRVREGDSLWRIAERKLGSGHRWREIFELNRGKAFGRGQRMTDPRLILPGWTLELPARIEHSHNGHRSPPHPSANQPRPKLSAISIEPSPGVTPQVQTPARATHRPVLRLPSGLVVATSFASGLLSAELLGLLRRRRRFRPLTDDVDIQADREFLQEIHSAGATTSTSILDSALEALTETWRRHFNDDPPIIAALEQERRVTVLLAPTSKSVPAEVGGNFSPHITFRPREGIVEADISGPFTLRVDTASSHEAARLVPICRNASASVFHLAPFGLGAISAEGSSVEGTVLQALVALAARSSLEELEIILIGVDGQLRAAEALPHVTRSASWEDAADTLRDIQAEFLRRTRTFFREGVEDARAYATQRPEERMRRMLIVAESPPEAFRGVIEAAAVEAARVGAALIAVGWKLQTTAVHVHISNEVAMSAGSLPELKGYAPLVLSTSEATDAAKLIRDALGEDDLGDGARIETERTLTPTYEGNPVEVEEHPAEETQTSSSIQVSPLVRITDASLPPAPAVDGPPCAEIRCLGPILVARRDGSVPGKGWRAPAKELLAYLVLHPDGAHKERLAELLFRDMPTKKALDLVARAASIVRTRVRTPGDERKYVELEGETWRLERGAWRVDAWEMERLIMQSQPGESNEEISRLRSALALYRGEFCDDAYFAWAQPARERYRALFLRASARLAERLYETGDAEDALAVLDRAIQCEPLCEDLYRRAMVIEASLGRRKEALDRHEGLKRLLETELDSSPDPETEQVARDIERAHERVRSAGA